MTMKDIYYVISNSDGVTTVTPLSKEQLLQRVEKGEYDKRVMSAIPENEDTNYWGGGVLIIKGTIVTPKAEITIRYSID
jgi:hypothetical protein